MIFILKKKDEPLIKFNLSPTNKIHILKTYQKTIHFTNKSLFKWINNRIIPYNREFRKEILDSLKIAQNDLIQIIKVSKCLTLNDDYWVVEENFNGTFKHYNLFENPFNIDHANIAFLGKGTISHQGTLPELTTQGMLKKAWINKDTKIYLYKGATSGFINSGNEPYSEYYAYQIGKQMGLDIIPYDLELWHNQVISTCECFCNLDKSYVPISAYLNETSYIKDIENFYKNLSKEAYEQFCSMMIFDALIYNTDRHTNNFGVYINNQTNHIIGMASLYDQGCSLFEKAYGNEIKDTLNLKAYRNKLTPAIGQSFNQNIKDYLNPTQQKQLLKLKGYKIKKHPLYNLPKQRLDVLNAFLQERIDEILNFKEEVITLELPKEKEFNELNEIEKASILNSLQLDQEIDDPNHLLELSEYASTFTYIPYYEDDKLTNIEIIKK